jgi:carboxylate-amine ligase
VNEAVCIAAILQAIVAKIWKLRRDNLTFRLYPPALIDENKWRAVRFGLDGNLIDFGKATELPARELITEMLEWFVDDVVDELGSRNEVEYAFEIMRGGTSADRQLRVYDQTGDLRSVVDSVVAETAEGVRPEIVSSFSARPSIGERYRAIKLGDNTSRQTQGAT